MKTHLLTLAIAALVPMYCSAADTNGFLVIEIGRNAYSMSNGKETEPVIKQSFKIPLTPEFLSNFKNPPIPQHSQGSGFCCSAHFQNPHDNPPGFVWWLERTVDHRWHAHMWGTLRNPSTTQAVTFKNLEDLDMFYEDSYEHFTNGVNVSFSAKYMSAEEMQKSGPMPISTVKKADRSELFHGDSPTNCPIVLCGLFQEN